MRFVKAVGAQLLSQELTAYRSFVVGHDPWGQGLFGSCCKVATQSADTLVTVPYRCVSVVRLFRAQQDYEKEGRCRCGEPKCHHAWSRAAQQAPSNSKCA